MIDEPDAGRHQATGTRLRRKGDALRERNDLDGARASYEEALNSVERALHALGGDTAEVPGVNAEADAPDQLADLFGVKGGLLRRLNRLDEALASYERGAGLERRFDLGATYNHANAVKLALLLGTATLKQARPELAALRETFERRLKADENAADDAWLWADLGDCRLLLGDVEQAEYAYRLFEQKAESLSPATTLAVLEDLAAALRSRGDPLSAQLDLGVARVRESLQT